MIDDYKLATAWISELGICLDDRTYSAKTAIKEQWFLRAKIKGPWAITVLRDPFDTSHIYLADYDFEICNVIEFELFNQNDLQQYHNLIEIYKESRRKFGHLKRVNTIGYLR